MAGVLRPILRPVLLAQPTRRIVDGPTGSLRLPSNTGAPSIAGDAALGGTLTGTPGTWAGLPTPTITHQWQRRDYATGAYADIPGETGLTYNPSANDFVYERGIRWKETATNAYGAVDAFSNEMVCTPAAWFTYKGLTQGRVMDSLRLTDYLADTTGTAAVVNGPVGFQYDRHVLNTPGSDVRNLGAIGIVGTATAATYNTGTGVGSVTRAADVSNQSFVQFSGLVPNTFYYLVFSVIAGSTIAVRTGTQLGTAFGFLSGTTLTCLALASTSGQICLTCPNNSSTTTFTLTSIQAIPGNHSYQLTSADRPTLRGTPTGANLVTNGTFANADGWTLATGWAIGGGTLNATALAPLQAAAFAGATITAGRVYRIVYTLSNHTAGGVGIRLGTGGGASYTDGTPRTTAGTFTEYITAGFSGAVEFVRRLADFTGSIDNVEVHDVTADVVTAPYWLQANGVNQWMQTGSIDFTGGDSMFVCAGVRKLSDAAVGLVMELSPNLNVNNGSFYIAAPLLAATANYDFSAKGTSGADASYTNAAIAAPNTSVISGIADISSDTCLLRVNGVQRAASVVDQGTGNYGNYALYEFRRGGTLLPFNGLAASRTIIPTTLTTPELDMWEDWTSVRTTGALI